MNRTDVHPRAFSLGEVMVVLIIIGVIAAIATPRMLSSYRHMIVRSAQHELSDLFSEACDAAMREQRLVEMAFDVSPTEKLLKRQAADSGEALFAEAEIDFGPDSQFDLDGITVLAFDVDGNAVDGTPLDLDELTFGCAPGGKLTLREAGTMLSSPIAGITLTKGTASLPVYVSSFGVITTDLSRITIMYNTNSTSFAQSPVNPGPAAVTGSNPPPAPTEPLTFMP